ncbi:MAG: hypothetical protein K8J09_13065 [Planctomycetes bacterium]|nr:hypothetical protein [Planctomycetota bacterium]MCC7396452.1 phospholipase D family protein [Planctomycetota bacterium]
MPENIELLTAHHLPYRVVNIIENAQEFVVLVTAYLSSWTHLDHAIKTTIARGVPISLVMRAPDGAKRDREKREEEASALKALGVQVHFVERLHAKAYVNEKEAIVTSFNLVSGSNESIELGVLIQDPDLVRDCVAKIRAYCPTLDSKTKAVPRAGEVAAAAVKEKADAAAFCIGCSEELPFNPTKPLCLSCYRSSKKGKDLPALPRRACHRCGKPGPGTLSRPICPECWQSLPKDVQARITATLA